MILFLQQFKDPYLDRSLSQFLAPGRLRDSRDWNNGPVFQRVCTRADVLQVAEVDLFSYRS